MVDGDVRKAIEDDDVGAIEPEANLDVIGDDTNATHALGRTFGG